MGFCRDDRCGSVCASGELKPGHLPHTWNAIDGQDGGYSTWRVDVTDAMEQENLFVIAVNNEENDFVYPQMADFTFYGGLYRNE